MLLNHLFVIAFGLITGSFLNVCIYRIPEGESIIKPSSHCIKCGKKLKAADLIPVFSYLLLRGKCRYCKVDISPRYVLVEIVTAAVFLLLFIKYGLSMDFIAMAYLMAILIAVFFIDLRHKIIPNELVAAGLIGSVPVIAYNIFEPLKIYSDARWWAPLLGILPGCGFLFMVASAGFLLYGSDDAMGMGDVKIFAPIGLFLGWKMCIIALLLSIITGGVSGIILVAAKVKGRRDTIPFGPFIVLGTLIAIMWGENILGWYLDSFKI
ncbi:MAG: prepilin peptidase [Acetivibrionales bacterium]|jgi:leader peptidase (prepilin peptidase)/N-methyltransferase